MYIEDLQSHLMRLTEQSSAHQKKNIKHNNTRVNDLPLQGNYRNQVQVLILSVIQQQTEVGEQ